MLNLIRDSWIPVRVRQQGPGAPPRLVAPHELAGEAVTGFCWGRADFNLSCRELITGLLQLAMPPQDDDEWYRHWNRPDPDRWRRALAPWAPYFELGGAGPRFAQDFEPFEDRVSPARLRSAASLLYDSPGLATMARNADHFVKRAGRPPLQPGEIAMALHVLQSWAPAGGGGYRVSMRGGGPLVTMVSPEAPEHAGHRLARELWANVMPGPALAPADAALALPWLRPAILSDGDNSVGPQESHPLEAYFGLPRRLRLAGGAGGSILVCQLPYGTRYQGWRHPLSPQMRPRPDSGWMPVRARPSEPDQRHWPDWSMPERTGGLRRPAPVVAAFRRRGAGRLRILAGGWAVDRARIDNFTIGIWPVIPEMDAAGGDRVACMANITSAFAAALRRACRLGQDASDTLTEEFLRQTAPAFDAAITEIEAGRGQEVEANWAEESLARAVAVAGRAAPGAERESIRDAFTAIVRRQLGLSLQDPDQKEQP